MSEQREKFSTGAQRSKDVAGQKGVHPARYDLITPIGLRRVAEAYGEGASKYGADNWKKGIPMDNLANHAIAHIYQFLSGDTSEDHLAHATWNLMTMAHFDEESKQVAPVKEELTKPELSIADNKLIEEVRRIREGKIVTEKYKLQPNLEEMETVVDAHRSLQKTINKDKRKGPPTHPLYNPEPDVPYGPSYPHVTWSDGTVSDIDKGGLLG